jgi:TIR domain
MRIMDDRGLALWGVATGLLGLLAGILTSFGKFPLIEDQRLLELAWIAVALVGAIIGGASSVIVARKMRAIRAAKRVFIVYAHRDTEAAIKVSKTLNEAGFDPWLDREHLLPGQKWKDEIRNALERSGVAVVLWSSNLKDSNLGMQELSEVLSQVPSASRLVIPVKIDNSELPPELAEIQSLDFHDPDADKLLLRSLEAARSP